MGVVLTTVTHESRSGLPEDRVVNSFVIGTPTGVDAAEAAPDIADALNLFYNTENAGGNSVAENFHGSLSRAAEASICRFYNLDGHLDGSPHGSPQTSDYAITLAAAAGGLAFPAEVATCLTLRGQGWESELVETPDADTPPDAKRDRPRQRASGRVFLGPLSSSVLTTDANDRTFITPSFITCVLDAAERFQDALAADDHAWMVWSRRNANVRVVESVSMDNAFDVIRKRGVDPTSRTARVLVP